MPREPMSETRRSGDVWAHASGPAIPRMCLAS